MTRQRWRPAAIGRALVTAVTVLTVTACGGSTGAEPSPAPRASASASGAGERSARAEIGAGTLGFGADAATATDFEGREDDAHAVAVQDDGKLVVAGSSSAPDQERVYFVLSRYLPDGRLDPAFGGGGTVVTDLASGDGGAEDVLIMGDGRIVAAGYGGRSFEAEGMAVMRYLPDGSPDPSFGGGDGYAMVDDVEHWGHECLHANTAALQSDGKLVLGGSVGCGGEAGGVAVAIARLNPDGSLDRSFDADGTQTFGFGRCAFATAVTVQGDGKILVGGGDGGCYEKRGPFRVARLNPDGGFDRGFGRRGRQKVGFVASHAWVEDLTLDPRGRIVLVGSAVGRGAGRERGTFALARLTRSGAPDPRFGDAGTTWGRLGLPRQALAYAGAVLGDGRIAVVGTMAEYTKRSQALISLYRSDGRLDRSFGKGGVRRVRFGGQRESAGAVAVEAAGDLVVAGSARFPGRSSDFGLARVTVDG